MILAARNISKTYQNGVKALHNFSLELRPGMIGLVGPNGSGKSTLMRTLATLQKADSGTIYFNNINISKDETSYRKTLGYLPQDFGMYPRESARSLLLYFAALKGIVGRRDRSIAVDRVLETTNLQSAQKERVSSFSGGMKQRFGIAQLLLNQPQIIIVDEPTTGLDPAERSRFLNVLRNIGSECIVLFSTHLVTDVQSLCKELAIIDKGCLIALASPESAIAGLAGNIWETTIPDAELQVAHPDCINLSDHYDDHNRLVTRLYSKEHRGQRFSAVQPTLGDFYFLKLKTADS
ncbi:MAG: ATP-binding cassette domain-containing protein [Saprospiraceae bacterium]|nr:ATP-binding cassette domain-containing protein [Saprospiraceae bacterium]